MTTAFERFDDMAESRVRDAGTPLAARHFAWRLQFETDPSDTRAELAAGAPDLVIVDARSRDAYAEAHLPGAISLPHGEVTDGIELDPAKRYVTYCWGPGCNAATKAAMKLASLGYRVREMIGGIEYWQREGYPVDASPADS